MLPSYPLPQSDSESGSEADSDSEIDTENHHQHHHQLQLQHQSHSHNQLASSSSLQLSPIRSQSPSRSTTPPFISPLCPHPSPPLSFKFGSLPTSSSFPPRPSKTTRSPSIHPSSPFANLRRLLKPSTYPSTRPRLSDDPASILQINNVQIVRVPEITLGSTLTPTCHLAALNPSSKKTTKANLLPRNVIHRILEFLPDSDGFPSTFLTRSSGYGFDPSSSYFPQTSSDKTSTYLSSYPTPIDESEGVWWPKPPLEMRLVGRQWAVVGAEVFFRHMAVHNSHRLVCLLNLIKTCPHLAPTIRTLLVSLPPATSAAPLRQLLGRLPCLRALSIRGLPHLPRVPKSVIRLAVEIVCPSPVSKTQVAELAGLLGTLPPTLKSLRINGFRSNPTFSLPDSVTRLDQLLSLELFNCAFLEHDARVLALGIKSLRTLRVENSIVEHQTVKAIQALIDDSTFKRSLEQLEIKISGLTIKTSQNLVVLLMKSQSTTLLNIDGFKKLTKLDLNVPFEVKLSGLRSLEEAIVDEKCIGQVWFEAEKLRKIGVYGWKWGEVPSGGSGSSTSGGVKRVEVQVECWRRGVEWVDGRDLVD